MSEKNVPLHEDSKSHTHDDKSFDLLMKQQEEQRKRLAQEKANEANK